MTLKQLSMLFYSPAPLRRKFSAWPKRGNPRRHRAICLLLSRCASEPSTACFAGVLQQCCPDGLQGLIDRVNASRGPRVRLVGATFIDVAQPREFRGMAMPIVLQSNVCVVIGMSFLD